MRLQYKPLAGSARVFYGALAIALGISGLLPLFAPSASAAGQVVSRSLEMSDATVSNTGTSYQFSFTPFTTGAQSMVIDFCTTGGSIIGGSCTAPAGMDAKTSLGFTAGTNTTNWAKDTVTSIATVSRVAINKGTGSALTTAAMTFTLTGIVNPSATGSFWARVYTYTDATYGSSGTVYSSPTVLGSYVDYGGFALSTTALINVTATIMETLTFCASKAAPTSGCGGTTTPTLTLGHGSPQILDSTQVDTDTAYTQLSTNALSGVIVRMKAHNTCSGLSRDNGSTCPIPGIGAFGTISAATADFGLLVADGTGGTGTVTANANYGTTAANYGMGASVTSTYGDPIESSAGGTADVNSLLTFAAQASATTPAGVYTAAESLVATGTF